VGPPSGLGHHHVISAPLGDEREHRNQTGSDIDVPFGDRSKKDVFRKGRAYKKGNWTAAEILVLQVSLLSTCCQSPPNSSSRLKKMFYAFVVICRVVAFHEQECNKVLSPKSVYIVERDILLGFTTDSTCSLAQVCWMIK
jgi:hypothetical protein